MTKRFFCWHMVLELNLHKLFSGRIWVQLLTQCSSWKDPLWSRTITPLLFRWNINKRIWGWLLHKVMQLQYQCQLQLQPMRLYSSIVFLSFVQTYAEAALLMQDISWYDAPSCVICHLFVQSGCPLHFYINFCFFPFMGRGQFFLPIILHKTFNPD